MSFLAAILLSINLLTTHPITSQANMSVLVQNLTTGELIDSYPILEYTGVIDNGVLQGDLYIRGGCDPSLGWKGKTSFLNQWVKAVKEAGITRINGAVIADMTMLDGEAQNPGWLCEDVGNYYAPGIFALNYYGNTMNIVLKSAEPGTVATVVGTEPNVEDIVFINRIRCDQPYPV